VVEGKKDRGGVDCLYTYEVGESVARVGTRVRVTEERTNAAANGTCPCVVFCESIGSEWVWRLSE
jgi:hypothetical protein